MRSTIVTTAAAENSLVLPNPLGCAPSTGVAVAVSSTPSGTAICKSLDGGPGKVLRAK